MSLSRIFWLLVLLLLILIFKPSGLWKEMKRIWAQRELVLRILVTVIVLYFLYGLYSLYARGMTPW